MNTRIFLPAALAAVTAGAGFLTLSRQAEAQQEPPQAGDSRSAPPAGEYHFRFRVDDGPLRFWHNGREVQAPRGGRAGEQDNPMAEMLRRLLEQHQNGQGPSALEELWGEDENGRTPRRPSQLDGSDENGSPLNPQRFMEEMMRRMRSGQDGLGFGPGARDEEIPRTSKHHLGSLAEWRPLVAPARQSTVRLFRKNRQVALATVVSADGYALTKASEVEKDKGKIEAGFSDGRIVGASVVDEMKAYDLALIKLDATGLIPAKFADTDTPVGTLIAAVSTDEDPTGIGVISVAARSLDERSKGFLGIQMSEEKAPEKGVLIGKIVPEGAAERAGMQEGDIILSIDGEEILNFPQLRKLVVALKPDQKVKVLIARGGQNRELELSLGSRSEIAKARNGLDPRAFDQTALMGSNLSRNASGYPNAVQSDLALQAEDAGGPVIDVNGSVVGLNIARSERVSTYLIPGKVVNALLTDVQSGKFSLSKDADTLNSELREINSTIQKAQDAMKKAEQERDEAMKALERLQKK